MSVTIRLLTRALATALIGVAWLGCSGEAKQAEEECVDPPAEAAAQAKPKVKVERFGLGKVGEEDKDKKDWCRACVMSKVGYASCQKVYAKAENEPRTELKARARATACADAKFRKDQCPDSAVISLLCKGDAPPAGTPDPGTALQNLHQALSSGKAPKPAADAEQPADGDDDATKAPAATAEGDEK